MVWNSLYDSDDYDPDGDLIGTIISIIIFTTLIILIIF